MFCDEVLDAIEAIAGGEMTPHGRVAEHLATCRQCAAALESARRLEQQLRARPVPRAPQQFTVRIMGRLRRTRWRRERFVDTSFNIALGLVALGVAVSVMLLLYRGGIIAASPEAVDFVEGAFVTVVRRVVPSLPVYAAAAALVVTALAIWWWAERDTPL